MPFTNIPAYPKDLYCQNITNTITPATWSKVSRLRWKFTPAYLPNINGTLGPMDLISVKDSTNTQVILVRYADKKLFFKISGISNELSLDVSSTMFASIAFITYEDVSGKKLGSVVVFDEYNNTNMQSLQISVDPATWGSTTIETFKNKSNNNADVISGMQLCTEIVPNSFENAPLIYKICFYGVLLLISYLVITRVLNMARGKF
jgi:hypothetical protein